MMSERVKALAERYRQANVEFLTLIDGLSEEQWKKPCPNENRTVGVVAHHIATNSVIIAEWAKQLGNGQAIEGFNMELVDRVNAQHAREHAETGKVETVELENKNTAEAVKIIEGLSNEQLNTAAPHSLFGGNSVSAEQLIEKGLIGHLQSHLKSIRAALV
jgi:hypothetical protein